MSGERKSRNRIISEWHRKNRLGHSGLPIKPGVLKTYIMRLVDVAAADGTLSEQE